MGHVTMPRSIVREMTVDESGASQLWEVLVPTESNDGTPFRTAHHRQWDDFVTAIAGGMTLVRPMRGTWVDRASDVAYTERVIPVRVVCSQEQIVEIAKEAARHYDQAAVLAYLVSKRTVMVMNPNATVYKQEGGSER